MTKIVPRGRSIRIRRDSKIEDTTLTPLGIQRRVSVGSAEVSLFIKDDEEIAYIDEFSCCPPPFAMVLITLLELAFFLTGNDLYCKRIVLIFYVYISDELAEKNSSLTGSGVTAKIFIYEPNKRHQAWRFLTYMFVHIG